MRGWWSCAGRAGNDGTTSTRFRSGRSTSGGCSRIRTIGHHRRSRSPGTSKEIPAWLRRSNRRRRRPPSGESRAGSSSSTEVTIEALPETVWRALTEDIGRWWRDGFYALGNARGMRLEPTLGGRMYEHADDGSAVVWFTVIAIQPGRSIDLAGHITVAFGGPTVALLRFEVEKTKSATRLKVSESRIGAVADAAAKETQNGWRLLLDEGLKPFVESAGSRKKRTKAK
ncbi:MAG: SRPBCC domain-containing protein [Candidatus Eisenbacteria bacterium]